MSCNKSFKALLVAALFISGCGFKPLYQQASRSANLPQIKIKQIADRSGQVLRNYLLDSLTPEGEPLNPQYQLEVVLTVTENDFSFRTDSTPRRTVLTSTAQICLRELNSKRIVYQDTAEAVTAYAIGAYADTEAFSTLSSKKKEIDQGLRLLSEEIKLQLATYFSSLTPS